jgi:hypothetical protein
LHCFSTIVAQPSPTSITLEEAKGILDSVLIFLKLGVPGKKLDELKDSSTNVQEKWQSMIEVRLHTELHVINAFGYESSQHGMMAYRQTMANLMQTSPPSDLQILQKCDKSIWSELLSRGFGVDASPIELTQAKQVVFTVTSELQQNACIEELQKTLSEAGTIDDVEKNKILKNHLFSVWKSVLPKYGFDGDDGYVKFQAALVDHSSDPEIATMIQSALMAITTRAGFRS